MEYLKICEVAKRWGLSERGVQALCAQGKIEGAARFGRSWMIPKDAKKPIDGRTKAGKTRENADMPLPRKTPFLYTTANIYAHLDYNSKLNSADAMISGMSGALNFVS